MSKSGLFVTAEERGFGFVRSVFRLLVVNFVTIIRLLGFSQTGRFIHGYHVMMLLSLQSSPFSTLDLDSDGYWVNAIRPHLHTMPDV